MAEGIHLPTVAGTLVGLAGGIHLALGVEALAAGVTLLPILLVLWGTVALAGVAVTAVGIVPRRIAYVGGLALVIVSVVGYVDVYALGFGESALGVDWQPPGSTHEYPEPGYPDGTGPDGHDQDHDPSTNHDPGHDHDQNHDTAGAPLRDPSTASLLERLASGHYALPSKVVELAAIGVLVALLVRERDGTDR